MEDFIIKDAAIYQYFIMAIVILEGCFLLSKFRNNGNIVSYSNFHPGFILALAIFVLLGISYGTDRENYSLFFEETVDYGYALSRSVGWSILNIIISKVTHDVSTFFLIISFIYVFSIFFFCKKIVTNYSLLFLATISFLGFYGMGTNTLKSGLSLAICLWAFYYHKSKVKFCAISLLSIFLHTTTIFPITAFIIYRYIKDMKTALRIWFGCLIVSYAIGPLIVSYVGSYITDDYTAGYFVGDSDVYKVGFRIDFIMYSLVPIILGYYYSIKKKYNDYFWQRLYITYILTNSIWLLLIRLPFTDRFAYLSWFLFPYILLMPFLKESPTKKNLFKAYKIMFLFWLFNFILFLR